MRNISLTVSYDGTNYHGWQSQPNVITVQDVVKAAAERILNHEVIIIGGARTDSGVHAMGQVINFATEKEIAPERLAKGINAVLPRDIRVRDGRDVADDFHARYSAKSKVYVYTILNRQDRSPFLERYVLHFPYHLSITSMKEAISLLRGAHDFSAFKKKDETYHDPVREIRRAGIGTSGRAVYVVLEANGFLRYMVRNIVGTLLLVGQGKIGRTTSATSWNQGNGKGQGQQHRRMDYS